VPRPLLVVAAWAPELAALGHALPRRSRALTTAVVGIGAVEAAAGAARIIAEVHPARVILLGTAGLYRTHRTASRTRASASSPALAVGGAAVVRRMHLASLAVARKLAYLPGPMPASAACEPGLRSALARATRLPVADVACPLGITRAPAVASRLRQATGAALENLEAFSVARAAAAAKIPFAAILGIANHVGRDAHVEWRAHGGQAAAAACAALVQFLEASPLKQ
jgi:purine-nucleoside phosphorylase